MSAHQKYTIFRRNHRNLNSLLTENATLKEVFDNFLSSSLLQASDLHCSVIVSMSQLAALALSKSLDVLMPIGLRERAIDLRFASPNPGTENQAL